MLFVLFFFLSSGPAVGASGPNVAVIGAGVVGLTTGITLLENGFSVTIIAEDITPNVTSDRAAAFWLPFLSEETEVFKIWSKVGYEKWKTLVSEDSHIKEGTLSYLYPQNMSLAIPWWADFVDNFTVVNNSLPGFDAFELTTTVMQTHGTMPWLHQRFLTLGGVISRATLVSLDPIFINFDYIVNCCGLGARQLVNDQHMHPIRGQIVIVDTPPGFDETKLYLSEQVPNQLAYIVPRFDGVLLGGTAQEDDWNNTTDPLDAAGVINRTSALIPQLLGATVQTTYAGLRPFRDNGVRLEADAIAPPGKVLIHNYGHGGSGWTVSWGCATNVLSLLREFICPVSNSVS